MARQRLTDRTMKQKPPASGTTELWDTDLPGFGARISYGGRKTFFVMTRVNGKQRRFTVGQYPLLTLAEARDRARKLFRDAAKGVDPKERERIDQREAQKARQDTFAIIAKQYMQEHGSKRKSGAELQRKLDKDILPVIGHLPIAEITRADIKELLLEKAAMFPVAANRLLALIRPIFNYAVDEERLDSAPNFRKLMEDETPRDRVLMDSELRDVWRAAERLGHPYGHLIRLLILTAQRRGEVAGLSRGELDGDGWKLPSERSKNGKGHLVPLSAQARAILDDSPQIDGSDLIFAGQSGEVTGWSVFKSKLDRIIMDIRREDAEKAGTDSDDVKPMAHWTPHDLRRTTATGLQSMEFSDDVIDRVLNHVQTGVRKHYNHFARNPEKERALEAWAKHVEAIVSGKPAPANVVPLRG